MKENWEKLIALLSKMVELYSSLVELSKQKSAAIIAANMKEIDSLTQREELLIAQAGKLEAARAKLMQQIAADLGVDGKGLTLSKIRELAEPEFAESLGKIAGDFGAIMNELLPINQLNAELIQQALSYVNYNINLMSQSVAAPTYAPQGQSADGARAFRVLDRKV